MLFLQHNFGTIVMGNGVRIWMNCVYKNCSLKYECVAHKLFVKTMFKWDILVHFGSLFHYLNLSCFRGSGIWFNSGAIFFELK